MDFVHLHVHSHFTPDGGVASPSQLVRAAHSMGMRSLALTDFNTLAGLPAFLKACKDYNIHPVAGAEVAIRPFHVRHAPVPYYRMVLLVESELGYRNLASLITRAHETPIDGTACLNWTDLDDHIDGLIVLIGGIQSELYQLLNQGVTADTESYLKKIAVIFTPPQIAFELQDFGQPRHRTIVDRLIGLSEFLRIRCVATNDVHYIRPEDELAYQMLRRETPPTLIEFEALKTAAHTRHLTGEEPMRARFRRYPRALFGTMELSERCAFSLNLEKRRFPVHDFVRGFDADSYLWDLAFREARTLFPELTPDMKTRLNEEFDYIKSHALANHFLLLWNLCQHARQHRITMGLGSGNMISSFVAYILGITRINPLEHRLIFLGISDSTDRDLELRVEVPPRHREAVQDFLRDTFGRDHCAAVGRYVNATHAAIAKEACDWLHYKPAETLAELEEQARTIADDAPLERYFRGFQQSARVPSSEIVRYLINCIGTRPRGITAIDQQFAISSENLDHITPRVPAGSVIVTQIDGEGLNDLRVPRIVFDSSSVLILLDTAARWVRDEENAAFDPDRIKMDDEDTYALLSRGLTNGIEPYNSITLKSLLRANRPRNFVSLVKIKSMERVATQGPGADIRHYIPECLLTYRCAFIKAHYPLCYMAALLTRTYNYNDPRKFTVALREAKRAGFRILPPDINLSLYEFAPSNKAIRTGLIVVRGFGEKAFAELDRVRKGGDFTDLTDLCRRTEPQIFNNRVLLGLVRAGACDSFKQKRSTMEHFIETELALVRKSEAGPTLFDDVDVAQQGIAGDGEDLPEFAPDELIRKEVDAAGYCISHDPLHIYKDIIHRVRALSPYELLPRLSGREIAVAGFVDHCERDSPLLEDAEHVLLDLEGHVATLPVRLAPLYEPILKSGVPVLVSGLVHKRKDEVYLKGVSLFTLRQVEHLLDQVLEVELDLTGEPPATLRLIKQAVAAAKGGSTTIRLTGLGRTGLFGSLHRSAIERTRVHFSPPFYYALRKILVEDRIGLIARDDMDPALLHALSPHRFPRTEAVQTEFLASRESEPAVDLY